MLSARTRQDDKKIVSMITLSVDRYHRSKKTYIHIAMITDNNLSVDLVCVDIMVGGICLFKNQWGYICRGLQKRVNYEYFLKFWKK